MARKQKPETDEVQKSAQSAALVPLYSPLDVTWGIQAYRRGDMVLYTIRGEPKKVEQLVRELDRRGVSEVVALVSHRAVGLDPAEGGDSPDATEDQKASNPPPDPARQTERGA